MVIFASGSFKIEDWKRWVELGAHLKVLDTQISHLPTWVEVIAYDDETRIATYRVLTETEVIKYNL